MTDEVATYRDWISKQWGRQSGPEPACNGESHAGASRCRHGDAGLGKERTPLSALPGHGVTLVVGPPPLETSARGPPGEHDALGKSRSKAAEPLSKHSSNSSSGPVSSSSATQSSSSDVVSAGRGLTPGLVLGSNGGTVALKRAGAR